MKSEVKQLQCPICGKFFIRRVPVNDSKYRFCSTTCKKAGGVFYRWSEERKIEYGLRMKGEGNNNYGNKWSEEQKNNASIRTLKKYKDNPELRISAGSANRGKKFNEEKRLNISLGKRGLPGHPHSIESKIKIGIKSKEKWNAEYLKAHRDRMEKLGHWIPKECKAGFELYYEEANWIGSMVDYFNEDELISLKNHGIFNPYTNTKGFVRDHIFCRIWGYMKAVPACILRHPANLAFISHAENVRKGFIDKRASDDEISSELSKLVELIKKYEKEWVEQSQCLAAIKEMELNHEV